MGEWGRQREAGKERLFTQIAALSVCNQRAGGGGDLRRDSGNIFSVHLISRAFLSAEEQGRLQGQEHWWQQLCFAPALAVSLLRVTGKEEGWPGRGWGRSVGTPAPLRSSREVVGPGSGRRAGQGWASLHGRRPPMPWGKLEPDRGPGVSYKSCKSLHHRAHLAINPSIPRILRSTPNGVVMVPVIHSVFLPSCEHSGARLFNAHIFSKSQYLAVLRDCPQSPLSFKTH